MFKTAFGEPGGDLLFRALRQSTIGAGAFHFRVRDGIGWGDTAITTRLAKSSLFPSRKMTAVIAPGGRPTVAGARLCLNNYTPLVAHANDLTIMAPRGRETVRGAYF